MLNNSLDNKKNFIQFIKFCAVGVSNTVVYLGTYYLLLYLGVHYLVANVIGFIISVFNAYYWNNKFVFKNKNESKSKTIFKTYIAYGITTCISSIMMYILVNNFSTSKIIAPLITLLVTIPLNFLLNKYWTFKDTVNSKGESHENIN